MNSDNFVLPPLMRFFNWTQVIVLTIAASIFFLPDLIRPFWPWAIAPFNAGYVGAVYVASLVPALLMTLSSRWSPARIVISMLFVFTVIVLAITFLHLDQFNFLEPIAWGWIFFYTILPINCAYHLWLFRKESPAEAYPTSERWRYFLFLFAALIGLYGLALIIAPIPASAFWPWPIDAFHGQMYSSTFITVAVGCYLIARQAASAEWKTLGLTLMAVGVCSILGILMVNGTVPLDRKVNWSLTGTWVWFAFMATIATTGMMMFINSNRKVS